MIERRYTGTAGVMRRAILEGLATATAVTAVNALGGAGLKEQIINGSQAVLLGAGAIEGARFAISGLKRNR
ncbi:MAG: hypothetical protein ACM3IJ_05530 [Candidatus Levyibacteriota bacterium]